MSGELRMVVSLTPGQIKLLTDLLASHTQFLVEESVPDGGELHVAAALILAARTDNALAMAVVLP